MAVVVAVVVVTGSVLPSSSAHVPGTACVLQGPRITGVEVAAAAPMAERREALLSCLLEAEELCSSGRWGILNVLICRPSRVLGLPAKDLDFQV